MCLLFPITSMVLDHVDLGDPYPPPLIPPIPGNGPFLLYLRLSALICGRFLSASISEFLPLLWLISRDLRRSPRCLHYASSASTKQQILSTSSAFIRGKLLRFRSAAISGVSVISGKVLPPLTGFLQLKPLLYRLSNCCLLYSLVRSIADYVFL